MGTKIISQPLKRYAENQKRVISTLKAAEAVVPTSAGRVPQLLKNEINRQRIILNRAVSEFLPVRIKRIKPPR